MEEIIINIILGIILACFFTYSWRKLLDKSDKLTSPNYLIAIILVATVLNLSNYLFPQPIRLVIMFVVFTAINYFLISKNIKQSIILVVISQMVLALVESSFAIICSLFFGEQIYELLYEPIPSILMTIYIWVVSSFIINRKILKKIFLLFYNTTKNNENIIYPLIIIFILVIATVESHMRLPLPLVLTTNVIMAIVFISIIIASTKLKENYTKISSKYETSISSLKEYEVMIDKFRVNTHENKNEFLTIRNMIKNNERSETIIKYIDKLVDNKIKDNDKIMKKTASIPEGGLRATIYSKLCLMDKLKIKYQLNISREIKTTNLINLDEDLILKICKILGVFLDNAIEAVQNLSKKAVIVDIYTIDNYLCIDITNNFQGDLNLNNMGNIKYTTKGNDHGYGLTLVNKLLEEEHDRLENEKSVNRDTFTQTLKIKLNTVS